MNCDLRRSHDRIFAHQCPVDLFLLLIVLKFVILCPICKLKPENLKKNLKPSFFQSSMGVRVPCCHKWWECGAKRVVHGSAAACVGMRCHASFSGTL